MLAAGLCLSYSYSAFWYSGKENLNMYCQKYHILWVGKTLDVWLREMKFLGQSFLKPLKTEGIESLYLKQLL